MTLRTWQVLILLAATLMMGLTAGVFGDWAHTIMPGLGTTDDRTFVGAVQALDRAILNPLFMLTFTGALVLSGVAAILYLRDNHSVLLWVAVAFGLYLAAFIVTMAVHEPLNHVVRTAGDPDRIADLAAVRDALQETRWVAWHIVRTIATTVAFGCLAWALVLHGRVTATDEGPRRPGRHPDRIQERRPEVTLRARFGFTLNGRGGQGARTGRVTKWPVRIVLLHNVGSCRMA